MSENIKQVAFESRDKLQDIANMLCLVEKSISEIDHDGEDVAVKGSSAILWNVIKQIGEIEAELSRTLKGGHKK